MRVSVNGAEVGQDLLSNMGWPFEELIAYASRGTRVRAGDVLGSGTCGNGGCLAELWGRRGELDPPPLRPGDVVEMTVEGIGTIRNRVVAGRVPAAGRARPAPPAQAPPLRGTDVFEYFPGNYVWNLGVVATLNSGGLIDEVDRACRPIKEAAARGADAGTPEFLRAWTALTDQLVGAGRGGREGRPRLAPPASCTSGPPTTCARPSGCCPTADPDRIPHLPAGARRSPQKASTLRDPAVSRVAIPYEGTHAAGLLQRRTGGRGRPAPVVVLVNGLDSTKEHMYTSGHWQELAARGISCLMLDQPGTGEALRLQGLTARIDTEAWAGAAVDWLLDPRRRRPARIGIVGWSLGGYYAPRAAAFEKRLRARASPGAPTTTGARCSAAGSNARASGPVPHYWEHVLWVWGHDRPATTFIDVRRRRPPRRRRRADHRAVPRSRTAPTTGRSRWSTRTAPTSRRSTAPSASCGSSPPRRAPPSTSASTTCRT